MGANNAKLEDKKGRHMSVIRLKFKVPKFAQRIFKKKKKYHLIEGDECDSAKPYFQGDGKVKAEADIQIERGISVETNEQGDLHLVIDGACGYTGIPTVSTEWDGEDSFFSIGILDTDKEQLSSPVSLEGNPFDTRTVNTLDSAVDVCYSTDTSVEDCQLCKAKNIEYMVNTFLTKLQKHLIVKELLPYLHFLDEKDTRALSIIEPQELAVERLIDVIKKNYNDLEQGKWTIFLTALQETGNKYMYELLTGKTEKEHHFTVQILKYMKPSLINDIQLTEFLDLLFEKEIINIEDKNEIESIDKNVGPIQAVRVLLEKVDKRIPNWYTEFSYVLHKANMSHVAEVFKRIEYHEHVTPEEEVETSKRKPVTAKRVKRKVRTAKRGKCRKHNQAVSACVNSSSNEPDSKRIRTDTHSVGEDCGTMNMAFSMPSIGPKVEMEVEELKNGMTRQLKIIESNQKELMDKIDALTNSVAKLMN